MANACGRRNFLVDVRAKEVRFQEADIKEGVTRAFQSLLFEVSAFCSNKE